MINGVNQANSSGLSFGAIKVHKKLPEGRKIIEGRVPQSKAVQEALKFTNNIIKKKPHYVKTDDVISITSQKADISIQKGGFLSIEHKKGNKVVAEDNFLKDPGTPETQPEKKLMKGIQKIFNSLPEWPVK